MTETVVSQGDRDAAANELFNIVYHHCVTKYDPEAGKRVAADYLARHAATARQQALEEAAAKDRRICSVCTAVVASYPEGMCCHCHELPWPLIGDQI